MDDAGMMRVRWMGRWGGFRAIEARAMLSALALLVARAAMPVPATAAPRAAATGPLVKARAAVVMDADTGALLYAKDPDRKLPPASTTKVMTAILALESGRLEESVPVSHLATRAQPSKLYLRAGERAQLRDLTYAMLLRSANDASVVVAEALGGSVSAFAVQMNRRAAEIGARNTHFVNPNGLPARDHYSTARDLALIFRHALGLADFRSIAATRSSRLITWRGKTRRRSLYLQNTNRLLATYRVPVIGKTGYTRAAKRCFVGAAQTETGRDIVIALLGSTDLWGDARRLLDFGFAHAASTLTASRPSPVPSAGDSKTSVAMAGAVESTVQKTAQKPVETALATPPPSDLDATDTYSLVLVPVHNSRAAAERLRHYVDRRGHYAVVETTGNAPEHYRVRILNLPDLDAALETGARLRAENLEPVIVPPVAPGKRSRRVDPARG